MVTPFDERGAVNLDATQKLVRWLVEHGSEALVVTGTTGESPTLTDDEKQDVWRAAAEAATVPVIAGSGSNDTAHSVELTKAAQACGVAAILAVTPYYNRPSQSGIEAHFRAMAEATDLPVMLYDIPIRTGRKIAHDTMIGLARDVRNIVAVKDAAGDVPGSARLVAEAPAGFELYSGDDGATLPLASIGAVGVVSVAAHWAAPQFAEMLNAYWKGDVETARNVNARLIESYQFESGDANPNPIPTKVMMNVLGLNVGKCRLPMGPPSADLEARAREVLANLQRDSD